MWRLNRFEKESLQFGRTSLRFHLFNRGMQLMFAFDAVEIDQCTGLGSGQKNNNLSDF